MLCAESVARRREEADFESVRDCRMVWSGVEAVRRSVQGCGVFVASERGVGSRDAVGGLAELALDGDLCREGNDVSKRRDGLVVLPSEQVEDAFVGVDARESPWVG